MHIGKHTISLSSRPFIIAEMSGNHNGSLDRALAIVDAAAKAGAHAIKLQTYTADTMTLDSGRSEFLISDSASLWKGETLHSLFDKAHTPWEWHQPIMERAQSLGLACFSSPFDESAVDYLEQLGAPAYKIASFECIDLPLIRRAAATGKPLIISTGMASVAEIADAVTAARGAGCKELVLLKCSSSYPASPGNSNLRTIGHMRDLFQCEVGLSDHTLGIGVAVAAIALGATVIEKHLTLCRADGGVDAAFSLERDEFANLVRETEYAWQSIGQIKYGPTEAERNAVRRRRSLYIAEDMKTGDRLTPRTLRRIRPGDGLPPKFYDVLLGKRVSRDLHKGTPLTWDAIG